MRRLATAPTVLAAAGLAVASTGLTATAARPAAAWELGYQSPDRGLRESYANGEYKIVSRSDKRIDTWSVYDKRGNLLRRTLTLDSFFVIERSC